MQTFYTAASHSINCTVLHQVFSSNPTHDM